MIEAIMYLLAFVLVSVIIIFLTTKKPSINETLSRTQVQKAHKNKEAQKLLRFTRGNKALTPSQQHELFTLNEQNLKKLRQLWREKHL